MFIFQSDGPKEENYRRIFLFKSIVPSHPSIFVFRNKMEENAQKNGHISDHCSDSYLHPFGSKDGKQMKGKYPPFVTAVKHSSWKFETILT